MNRLGLGIAIALNIVILGLVPESISVSPLLVFSLNHVMLIVNCVIVVGQLIEQLVCNTMPPSIGANTLHVGVESGCVTKLSGLAIIKSITMKLE